MLPSDLPTEMNRDDQAPALAPAAIAPPRAAWWRQTWFVSLWFIGATLLIYQPAWFGAPLYDDMDHLTPPELQSLEGLAQIWTKLGVVSQYYPVTHTVFWLQHRLWGDSMLGYHLLNIVLHAVGASLLWRVLRRLAIPGAWLAAAIYAVHPIMVESVAWVSELKNTLSSACYLAAALAYLDYDAIRRRSMYGLALGLFVVGLLSKGVIAVLPAVLLVAFWWQRGRISWRRDVVPLLPFFVAAIGMGLLTAWMERKFIGAEGAAFALTPVERVLIAGRVIWFYLGHLFWPSTLIFIYPRWHVSATAAWQYVFPFTAVLLVGAAWAWRRRSRGPLAALLIFIGSLVPVLGFLNVYPFRYSFVADHYCYLASIAVFTAMGAVVARGWTNGAGGRRAAFGGLSALILVTLGVLSWRQSHHYRDDETVWRATIAENPNCFLAYSNLSADLLLRGAVDEAIVMARKALALEPGFAEPYNSLGNALHRKGQAEEALSCYRKALEIRPDLAQVHLNIGLVYREKGDLAAAIQAFEQAVTLRPEFVQAHVVLANALLQQHRVPDAVAHLESALHIMPDDPDALSNLGNALLQKGDVDGAIVQLQRALVYQPSNAMTRDDLGNALLQKDRVDEAIRQYEQALAINPKLDLAHYNFAFALLRKNQVDDAVAHFLQALALTPTLAAAEFQLGNIMFGRGRVDDAIAHYERAIAAQPDFVEARLNLAGALFQLRRVGEVVTQTRAALAVQPDNPRILSSFAWLLSTWPDAAIRNGPEAVRLATRADELTQGRDPMIVRALAAAYAETGRFGDAVTTAQRALRLAEAASDAGLAGDLRAQIKLHEAGSPFRDGAP